MPHYNVLNGQRTSEEGKWHGEAMHMQKYVFFVCWRVGGNCYSQTTPPPREFWHKCSFVGGAVQLSVRSYKGNLTIRILKSFRVILLTPFSLTNSFNPHQLYVIRSNTKTSVLHLTVLRVFSSHVPTFYMLHILNQDSPVLRLSKVFIRHWYLLHSLEISEHLDLVVTFSKSFI